MRVKQLQIKITEEYADTTRENDLKISKIAVSRCRQKTGPYYSIVTIRTNQTAMLHDNRTREKF